MLKKKISFTDLDGNSVSEDWYFNLNHMEAIKIDGKAGGDITGYAQKKLDEGDYMGLISLLEEMILTAVGKRSEDGRSLIKSEEVRKDFSNSLAYAALFEDLFSTPGAMEEFGTAVTSGIKPSGATPQAAPQLKALPEAKAPSAEEEIARLRREHPEMFPNQ